MEINNIDEKFLLSLLESTDSVYFNNGSKEEKYFYFYPEGLGITIQVPCLRSHALEINFKFENGTVTSNQEQYVFFSIPNIEEASTFIKLLYEKNEFIINNCKKNTKNNEIIENILSKPINELAIPPYSQEEQIMIRAIKNNEDIQINIGRALFSFDKPKIFNPLSPIEIDCFIDRKTEAGTQKDYFKKLIPAYQIKNFPILNKLAATNKNVNSLSDLLEACKEINNKIAPKIHSFILNQQLEEKEIKQKKFKV